MSELVKALIAARKEMTAAKKGKDNPFFKSKYADLSSVIQAVKDPLEAHGLTFVQDIENGSVVTVLLHESGETMRLAPFPIMSTKQDAQGVGSGVTYARRYSLQTACGVPSDDDDGQAASRPVEAKRFPSPVTSSLENVTLTPEQERTVADVRLAIIDLYDRNAKGEDVRYEVFELLETADNDIKLAVWLKMAAESKQRNWAKKVQAEVRAETEKAAA